MGSYRNKIGCDSNPEIMSRRKLGWHCLSFSLLSFILFSSHLFLDCLSIWVKSVLKFFGIVQQGCEKH